MQRSTAQRSAAYDIVIYAILLAMAHQTYDAAQRCAAPSVSIGVLFLIILHVLQRHKLCCAVLCCMRYVSRLNPTYI